MRSVLALVAIAFVVLFTFVVSNARTASESMTQLIIKQENINRGYDTDIRFREQ
jgi:uncharacterized protein YoxC